MTLIEEIAAGCDADLIDVLVLAGDIGLVSDGSLALFLSALVRRLETISTRVERIAGDFVRRAFLRDTSAVNQWDNVRRLCVNDTGGLPCFIRRCIERDEIRHPDGFAG